MTETEIAFITAVTIRQKGSNLTTQTDTDPFTFDLCVPYEKYMYQRQNQSNHAGSKSQH